MKKSVAGGLNQTGFSHFGFGHSPRGVMISSLYSRAFLVPARFVSQKSQIVVELKLSSFVFTS